MKYAFYKAMRWWIIVMLVIAGTTGLVLSQETNSMEPLFFTLSGYGFGYVIAALWKEVRAKLMGYLLGIYLVITFFYPYVGTVYYILTGNRIVLEGTLENFALWAAVMTVVGVPAVTYVFYKNR